MCSAYDKRNAGERFSKGWMLGVQAQVQTLEIAQSSTHVSDFVYRGGFVQGRTASQEEHRNEQAYGSGVANAFRHGCVMSILMRLPLLLRDQLRFRPWPDNVPWKAEAEKASRLADNGRNAVNLSVESDPAPNVKFSLLGSRVISFDNNFNRKFSQYILSIAVTLSYFAGEPR